MGRRLVAGLGNPGPQYEATWHNLGFHAVRALAKKARIGLKLDGNALVGRGRSGGHDLFLVLPQTYMNLSGDALRRVAKREGIDSEEILVIYDDHDLPRGRLRLRERGGDGGHRGLRSILGELATDEVPRLRIGIRDEAADPEVGGYEDLADRVLDELTEGELEHMARMADAAAKAAQEWLRNGAKIAMNRINRIKVDPPERETKGGKEDPL